MNHRYKMLRTIARAIITIMALGFVIGVQAQDVSVSITPVRGTYSSLLTEWIDHPNKYVNVTITNNTGHNLDVYLNVKMECDYSIDGTPLSINTVDRGNTRPRMTLTPGINRVNYEQMQDMFRGRLSTTADRNNLLSIDRIPEGTYSFCVDVCRWSEVVSSDDVMGHDCFNYSICYTGSAPEIIVGQWNMQGRVNSAILNGISVLEPTRVFNIRWTGVVTNCSQNRMFNYVLKIVKVLPGQNVNDAIDRGPVVFARECRNVTYCKIDTLQNLQMAFERGATYAMQVTAKEVGGNNTLGTMQLGNGGKSQVVSFSWGTPSYVTDTTSHSSTGERENSNTETRQKDGSNENEIKKELRQHYITAPYRDETTFNSVASSHSDEKQKAGNEDKSAQLKYNGSYDDHVVDASKGILELKWMPVRGKDLKNITYTVNLYENTGALSAIGGRPALASKTINQNIIEGTTEQISLEDSAWQKMLVEGKKYTAEIIAAVRYDIRSYTVNSTVHFVNNIEADSENDTVWSTSEGFDTYTSTLDFQWGIDSSLLDKVLPPQFINPINISTASCDDTSYLHLGTTIEEIPQYSWFKFKWKKAQNLDIDDSVLYRLDIYELPKGKDIADAVKGKAKWTVDSISDLELTDQLVDSLKKNTNYVARLKISIYDSTKYLLCNNGWSQPIVFKLVDTLNYSEIIDVTNACFPADTAKLDRKPVTPKVDSLVNNRVKIKMGRFDMVLQDAKLKDGAYSGEGFVIWKPAHFGCGIKVKVEGLKINKDFQAIAGTARSMVTDSNNYLNLNLGNNKFGAGFDMYSDEGVALMNKYAGDLGSTGDDVKKWYNIINTGSNVIGEFTHDLVEGNGSIGVVTTPFRVNDEMVGAESEHVSIAVNDAFFSPVTAQMNLLAIFSSHKDNMYLPFIVTNICMDPNAFISDSIGEIDLLMVQNIDVPLADGYTMTFKGVSLNKKDESSDKKTDDKKKDDKKSDKKDDKKDDKNKDEKAKEPAYNEGTHITFDKTGFKELAIDVEINFGTKDQPGNKLLAVDMKNSGIVKADKPVKAYFYTKIQHWDNWYVRIGMDPFTIVGCENFTFVPTGKGIIYDHSEKMTPPEVNFPKDYLSSSQKKETWKGFYLDKFSILLPSDVSNTFVDLAGEESMTKKDSMVVYTYGANGQLKDSSLYVEEGTRISFSASQLILDKDGISVNASANDLLKLETKNGGGWAFSLDTVGVRFMKNKFKDGYIIGKMKIPLFSGNIKYNASLGTDSLDFVISPGDSLGLDVLVAKIDLNQQSSHFRITHDFGGNTFTTKWDGITEYTEKNKNATTRVDLTLNGTVSIDFKRFDIPVSLPKIKFENMYMRNYTAKTTKAGNKTVAAYKFNGLDFSIGNWSKASPQKYIGVAYEPEALPEMPAKEGEPIATGTASGFSYNLTTIEPIFEAPNSKKYKVGLRFGGSMKLGIGEGQSVGASAGFGIWCDVNSSSYEVSNFGGIFDSARVTTDIGPLSVDGFISHTKDDPVFGNSWKGMLKVVIMDVVDTRMGAGFGTSKRTVNGAKKDYDWWYLEGVAKIGGAGISLGPLAINGFGGAFAYNMKPAKDLAQMSSSDLRGETGSFADKMVSNNGSNFTPQYDAWIARAGVSMILTGSESTLNASGILNLRIANGHFAGISMQVDANVMSAYDKTKKQASKAMLTVGSFIDYSRYGSGDWSLNFSANVKADVSLASLIEGSDVASKISSAVSYPTSSLEGSGGALSQYVDKVKKQTIDYAKVEEKMDKVKNAGSIGASATLQIPIDLYVRKYPKGVKGPNSNKNTEWFFAIGRPNYSDRIVYSSTLDLVVAKTATTWTAYFMTGNYFPNGFSMPDIPEDVQKFLGSKYASANKARKLPTFESGGGFAFGASFYASLEVDLLLYLSAKAYIGFDAALLNTAGKGCSGYSTIGKNNFYGMGQAYAMIEGDVGLSLNLGFWKGRLSLASTGVGAVLQAGGPQPTWAYGLLAFKASVLGGLIKINTSVDFSLGHVCLPGTSDPLANVKFFQNVTPAYNTLSQAKESANIISPYTTGTIVSNLPWNEDVYLCADQKYGKGTTTRKFRFIIDGTVSKAWRATRDNTPAYSMSLKFESNRSESNVQYFEAAGGGFPDYNNIKVFLRARAFEWRNTKDQDMPKSYNDKDYYYDLGTNTYTCQNTKASKLPESPRWRHPVYTDRGVTTFKEFHQDTTFYLTTQKQPDNLNNAVVFTWPYNGDPHVPVGELYYRAGRYRTLIYLYNDVSFISKADADGRELRAFLIERGISVTNRSHACDLTYYPKGFLGSSCPCIEVALPSDFGNNYQGYDLAVRLMMVKKADYNTTLAQLREQAEGKTVQQREVLEKQSRNVQALRNKLNTQKSKYTKSVVQRVYNSRTRRYETKRVNVYDAEAAKNDIAIKQLQTAIDTYDTVADTAMLYARKMLKNEYAICMKTGAPAYTLYFRLFLGSTTYEELINKRSNGMDSYLSGPTTHNGKTAKKTITASSRGYDSKQAGRFMYLFAPYEPDDPTKYRQGVVLPPILYASIDYSKAVPGEYKVYRTYARTLIDMDKAVKATTVPAKRPRQKDDEFYLKSPLWTTDNMPNESNRTAINKIFQEGLFRTPGTDNFANLDLRIRPYTEGGLYRTVKASGRNSLPEIKNGEPTAPSLLRFELAEPKMRYDSTNIGRNVAYRLKDGTTIWRPEDMYNSSVTVVDDAVKTLIDDITRYHDFYQGLHNYVYYFHSRGWSHKRSQLQHLYEYSYRRNAFDTDFPYTITRSLWGTWWLSHWRAHYSASSQKRQKYEYKKMKGLTLPRSEMKIDDAQSLYYMDYILHFDDLIYAINNSKATLYTDILTTTQIKAHGTMKWFNGTSAVKTSNDLNTYKGGLLQSASSQTDIRHIPLNIYAVHGGSNSGNIFGIMANEAKQSATSHRYEFIANQVFTLKPAMYNYSLTSTYAKTLQSNSGLFFHNVSTKTGESYATRLESDQWE